MTWPPCAAASLAASRKHTPATQLAILNPCRCRLTQPVILAIRVSVLHHKFQKNLQNKPGLGFLQDCEDNRFHVTTRALPLVRKHLQVRPAPSAWAAPRLVRRATSLKSYFLTSTTLTTGLRVNATCQPRGRGRPIQSIFSGPVNLPHRSKAVNRLRSAPKWLPATSLGEVTEVICTQRSTVSWSHARVANRGCAQVTSRS